MEWSALALSHAGGLCGTAQVQNNVNGRFSHRARVQKYPWSSSKLARQEPECVCMRIYTHSADKWASHTSLRLSWLRMRIRKRLCWCCFFSFLQPNAAISCVFTNIAYGYISNLLNRGAHMVLRFYLVEGWRFGLKKIIKNLFLFIPHTLYLSILTSQFHLCIFV